MKKAPSLLLGGIFKDKDVRWETWWLSAAWTLSTLASFLAFPNFPPAQVPALLHLAAVSLLIHPKSRAEQAAKG